MEEVEYDWLDTLAEEELLLTDVLEEDEDTLAELDELLEVCEEDELLIVVVEDELLTEVLVEELLIDVLVEVLLIDVLDDELPTISSVAMPVSYMARVRENRELIITFGTAWAETKALDILPYKKLVRL